MRPAIWVAFLRPCRDGVMAESAMTLAETVKVAESIDLRMRFNPDIRLLTMRLPHGTKCEQILEAFDYHLSNDEKIKLYNLPQRPIGENRITS